MNRYFRYFDLMTRGQNTSCHEAYDCLTCMLFLTALYINVASAKVLSLALNLVGCFIFFLIDEYI